MKVPYFSQWASYHLAEKILDKSLLLEHDPLWAQSGAKSKKEYAMWANHICGMACFKMVLATYTKKDYSLIYLTKLAVKYGAYQINGIEINGMIYAPACKMLKDEFNIESEVITNMPVENFHSQLTENSLYIASVNPNIRYPYIDPKKKGGHLILVTKATSKEVIFHNPSGNNYANQVNVKLSIEVFRKFYAERGIFIKHK